MSSDHNNNNNKSRSSSSPPPSPPPGDNNNRSFHNSGSNLLHHNPSSGGSVHSAPVLHQHHPVGLHPMHNPHAMAAAMQQNAMVLHPSGAPMALPPPPTQPRRSSPVNTVLLYMSLIGSGAIVGYLVFYSMFSSKCELLIQDKIHYHNNTLVKSVSDDYNRVKRELQSCLDESRNTRQLHEAHGRMQAQSMLAEHQSSLLEKHQKALQQVSELQRQQDSTALIIQALKDELRSVKGNAQDKDKEKQTIHDQYALQIQSIHKDMEGLNIEIQRRDDHIGSLDDTIRGCDNTIQSYINEIDLLKGHFSRRQHGMTIVRYGNGPFTVTITLQFPPDDQGNPAHEKPNQIDIIVDSLNQMPHSVWTFLSLARHGLYDGTSFALSNNNLIQGGNPEHSKNDVRSKLTRKYAEMGYGVTPLTFTESCTDCTCSKYSVRFDNRGPDLIFHMNDDYKDSTSDEMSCFGKVIRGRETLDRIDSMTKDPNTGMFKRRPRITGVNVKSFGSPVDKDGNAVRHNPISDEF